jgi:hypothetical protein
MFFLPDPDDHTEWRLIIAFVGAIARADAWVFVFILLMLIAYAIWRFILRLLTYLVEVYQERVQGPSPYVWYFRILLGVGSVVLVTGIVLVSGSDTYENGLVLLCWGLGVFGVATLVLDWYAGRVEQKATPSLEGVTLDDVISWQNQVNEAYEAGLMARK